MDRRRFLATAVAGIAGPFAGVACAGRQGGAKPVSGYGPLRATRDLRDGKVRLHLPDGFSYRSFNAVGDTFSDGSPVPGRHDGMAAFPGPRDTVFLVRNHEVNGPSARSATRTAPTTRWPAAARRRSRSPGTARC